MEAATHLRPASVRVLPGDRVAVAGLVVDAIEIGARVLDREQTGANAEAVKAEMERATRELHERFEESARAANETLGDRQDEHLRALRDRLAGLEVQLQRLRDERDKQEELAAEHERGTAKGREYEELVFEALDALAGGQGDDCDAVGDVKGATRKTGDVVVGIEGCRGPARGRIVFEAKNSKLTKPEAMRELDRGRQERDADYAVLVVPSEDKLPARTQQLREYNGDKLMVVFDPEEASARELELAYRLARARVLMARGESGTLDVAAVGEVVERALGAMDEVRSIKQKLTGATTSIDSARELLDAMADTVRSHLNQLDGLLAG